MATKKDVKTIQRYLDEIGEADPTNQFIITELEYNETLGNQLKNDIKLNGMFTEKGRLSQAFIGYKMYLNNKIMLLTKLAMTVQDRGKLKLKNKPDATQMQIEQFMESASGF